MAVTAKKLKEYLQLPPDDYTLTGDASIDIDTFAAAVTERFIVAKEMTAGL